MHFCLFFTFWGFVLKCFIVTHLGLCCYSMILYDFNQEIFISLIFLSENLCKCLLLLVMSRSSRDKKLKEKVKIIPDMKS